MHAHVRFAAAASLIAFGSIIGVGALALVPPAVEKLLLARAEISHPPAAPCRRQTWLHFERDCVAGTAPRGDMPSIARDVTSNAVAVEEAPSSAESAPERPLTEDRPAATVPQESARQSDITAPEPRTPVPPPGAEEQRGAKPAVRAQARPPAPKKAARREQAAKRSTNEALRAVRRFGDSSNDIPVTAYAPDGKQRRIVIRPTSVQDVYYYSVPR